MIIFLYFDIILLPSPLKSTLNSILVKIYAFKCLYFSALSNLNTSKIISLKHGIIGQALFINNILYKSKSCISLFHIVYLYQILSNVNPFITFFRIGYGSIISLSL